MGQLLTQAAILGVFEKLSNAEVLAAITFRAAAALNLQDRGRIEVGKLADFAVFPVADYREILYQQGSLQPVSVWKDGNCITNPTTYKS
jgi:imidazolonepropionase